MDRWLAFGRGKTVWNRYHPSTDLLMQISQGNWTLATSPFAGACDFWVRSSATEGKEWGLFFFCCNR